MRYGGRFLLTVGLLILLSPPPAGTAPSAPEIMPPPHEMQLVHDAAGRVTLEVPKGWLVRSATGSPRTPLLIARAPGKSRIQTASVLVVEEDLPVPITPAAFAQGIRHKINRRDLVVIREGPTQIGDLQAFSRDATWRLETGAMVYGLETYLTSGTLAVMAIGLTANSPDRLREDLPVLSKILNTIRIAGAARRRESAPRSASIQAYRRDLFEAPTGAPDQPGAVVAGPGLPLPPRLAGQSPSSPVRPRSLGTQRPPVTLVGVIIGGEPQAILQSGATNFIVQRGDLTPWGRVRSITSRGVAVTSGNRTRMITFAGTSTP